MDGTEYELRRLIQDLAERVAELEEKTSRLEQLVEFLQPHDCD
jgi:hypothetical protein